MIVLLACGTSGSLMRPLPEDVSKFDHTPDSVTLADLQNGFKLYVNTCGGCHALHKPSEKTWAEWEKVLPAMYKEVPSLRVQEKKLIAQYIRSKSS